MSFILDGGPYMILIFIGALILLILSGKKSIDLFTGKSSLKPGADTGLNFILFGGIILAAIGIYGTVKGLYIAFGTAGQVPDINPQIILLGMRIALSTTLAGIVFMIIFSSIWFILKSLHSHKTK